MARLRFVRRRSCFSRGTSDVFLGEIYLGWIAETDAGGQWLSQPVAAHCKVVDDREAGLALLRAAHGVPT